MTFWTAPARSTAFDAVVALPGSKSQTNRELVLSALAAGPSTLAQPLVSRDTELMAQALERLGAQIERHEHGWQVIPLTPGTSVSTSIQCGLAGTVMRFVPPIAALLNGQVSFDGDPAARKRPMSTTIDSLKHLGVRIDGGPSLPFTVHGTGSVQGGELTIDASASSQFISALLLSAPQFERGLNLHHQGERVPSAPHIEMTIQALADRGVQVEASATRWTLAPQVIGARDVVIEPDLSNAGVFIGAVLVTGGTVKIQHWPRSTTQAGDRWREIAQAFGAEIVHDGQDLIMTSTGQTRAVKLDLSEVGELTPVIAAVAAFADGPSELTGIAHLRGHETDRLAAIAEQISTLGGEATITDDGLMIHPRAMHAANLKTYADHRMAHAAAIYGVRIPGVRLDDVATTSKTYPNFVTDWEAFVS